jgi:hypothetical protein
MITDPVFQAQFTKVNEKELIRGKWYFWNEKWTKVAGGPFDSEEEARQHLDAYAELVGQNAW